MPQQFLYWCMRKILYVLETYNIRKLEPYRDPAVVLRARVVLQGEDQADCFFVEEANRMTSCIVDRSIAVGEECR